MAVDAVGYSRLMGEDEAGTARAVREHREAARPLVANRGGRIVKTMGDGFLLEFQSVVSAVECALAFQKLMAERNADRSKAMRIVYRIGVNLGDVLIEGDDILGDGVNIAARLEAICEPGGVLISSTAHEHVRGKIDADFVDLGNKTLKNIARPVRVYSVRTGSASAAPAPSAQDTRGPPRLSLVVLPFANIGGDAAQEHFVDGVTESLTTDLSRIRGAFVIARNTSFTYKGKAVDVKAIGRDLSVRYVLEGSIQRSGNRMRINVQLIDAGTGNHIWAERFDKPLSDLFDMQDEIVARLAGALNAELIGAEARRAEEAPTPDSMDYYFQGMAWLNKGVTANTLVRAKSYFDRALSISASNVDALVGWARVDCIEGTFLFANDPAAAFAMAEAKLVEALSVVPDHARAHLELGQLHILSRRATQGIAECEHALALDRNIVHAHGAIGLGKIFIGRAEETEGHVMEAFRLSPSDMLAYTWMTYAAMAKLRLKSYEEAVVLFRRANEINCNFPATNFNLAAALARLGRLDEAHSAIKAGFALEPDFSLSRASAFWTTMSDNPTYRAQVDDIVDAMRHAGVPDR